MDTLKFNVNVTPCFDFPIPDFQCIFKLTQAARKAVNFHSIISNIFNVFLSLPRPQEKP